MAVFCSVTSNKQCTNIQQWWFGLLLNNCVCPWTLSALHMVRLFASSYLRAVLFWTPHSSFICVFSCQTLSFKLIHYAERLNRNCFLRTFRSLFLLIFLYLWKSMVWYYEYLYIAFQHSNKSSQSGLHRKRNEKLVPCPKKTHIFVLFFLSHKGDIEKQPWSTCYSGMNRDSCYLPANMSTTI